MFCDFSHLSKSAVPTCYRSTLNYSLTTAPLLPEYALWPCLPPPALPSELSTLKAIDGWACFDWFWIHLNIAVGEFSADVTEFTCWGRGGCWQKGKEFQWEKELEGRERWWGETSRPSWWERIRGRAENGKCSTDGDGREAHVWLIPQAVLSSGFLSGKWLSEICLARKSNCCTCDGLKKMMNLILCFRPRKLRGLDFSRNHVLPTISTLLSAQADGRTGLAQTHNSDRHGKGSFHLRGTEKYHQTHAGLYKARCYVRLHWSLPRAEGPSIPKRADEISRGGLGEVKMT